MNLRESLGHRPGVFGTASRTNMGSTGQYPRDFLLFSQEKSTEKGVNLLPGHRPGVPGTPGHPGGCQKLYVIFFYVPLLLPRYEQGNAYWNKAKTKCANLV